MKKDVILFAATLAMMSLTSCSETPDKPHVESKPESSQTSQTENAVYNFEKEFVRDTSEFNYIQGMKYVNGKIFLYGISDSDVEVNDSFELLDTDTNQIKDFSMSLEKKSVDKYCMNKKGLYISYADKNFESRIALVDSKTGKVLSDVSQENLYSVIDMYNDADGKLYVIKTNLLKSNREYTADIYSEDLVLQRSVNISKELKLDQNEEISGVVSYDKSYYMLTLLYDSDNNLLLKIHNFSSDFSKDMTYYFTPEKQSEFIPTGIFTDKSGNVYISSEYMQTSQQLYLVNFQDLSLSSDAVLENALMLYQGTDDYDIIYRTNLDESIQGYNFSDHKSTFLCNLSNELDPEMTVSRNAFSYGSEILISTQNENVYNQRLLSSSDKDGKNPKRVRISEDDYAGYTENLYITDNGDIYCFYINDTIDIDGEDEIVPDDNDVSSEEKISTENIAFPESENKKYIICHYDNNGKFVSSSDLTVYIGNGENIIVDAISSDESGNVYVVYHTDGSLGLEKTFFLACDSKGNKLIQESLTDSCNSACIFNSGKTVIVAGNNAVECFEFDIENGFLISSEEIKTEIRTERITNLYPGQGMYDFFYADNRTIYGYQSDLNKSEKIFSKDDVSDQIIDSDIQMFCPGGERDVICTMFDDSDEENIENEKLYILKRQ